MNDYQRSFSVRVHIRYYERQVAALRSLLTTERLIVLLGAGAAVFALKHAVPLEVGYVGGLLAGVVPIVLAGLRIEDRLERSIEFLSRWRRARSIAERFATDNAVATKDALLAAVAEAEYEADSPLRNLLLLAENDILIADDHDTRIVVPSFAAFVAPLADIGNAELKYVKVPRVWGDNVEGHGSAGAESR